MPPNRSGLGSSVLNTTRQIGITLGIAVLGAFVLNRYPVNITSQLTQRGVPDSISTTIANQVAATGAGASKLPLPRHLPISPLALHQAINQAFVDSIKAAFILVGIAMLVSALLAVFLLVGQKWSATETGVELAEAPVTTVVS